MKTLTYSKDRYLAFVFSEESRNELITLFTPNYERVICHHVTIAFSMDENMFDSLIHDLGDNPKVVVTSIIDGQHIGYNLECFTVEINDKPYSLYGQKYHITHSLNTPAKPVDSNKLMHCIPHKQTMNIHLIGTFEMIKK